MLTDVFSQNIVLRCVHALERFGLPLNSVGEVAFFIGIQKKLKTLERKLCKIKSTNGTEICFRCSNTAPRYVTVTLSGSMLCAVCTVYYIKKATTSLLKLIHHVQTVVVIAPVIMHFLYKLIIERIGTVYGMILFM